MPSDRPLLLFDGVCNLCSAAVQWLIERDPEGRLRFAPLQSRGAEVALARAGVEDVAVLPDSLVLIDGAGVHARSSAALRAAAALGFPWALARLWLIVPRFLRDALYAWVARNRYRWFGRREACMRPTPDVAWRFVGVGEGDGPG